MPIIFKKETFESGTSPFTFSRYDTSATPNGSLTLDSTSKINGTKSMQVVRTGVGGARLVIDDFGASYTDLYFQFYLFFPAGWSWQTATYTSIVDTFDSLFGTELFYTNLETVAGAIRMSFGGTPAGYALTSLAITPNVKTKVEIRIKINPTIGRRMVWINNNVEASPDYDSGNINTGVTAIRSFFTPESHSDDAHDSYYFDDYVVSTDFIGNETIPTATSLGSITGLSTLTI